MFKNKMKQINHKNT